MRGINENMNPPAMLRLLFGTGDTIFKGEY